MSGQHSSADPFTHSMTDLMAGVAVTFLLIAGIFIVQAARRAEEEASRSQQARAQLDKIVSTDEKAISEIKALHAILAEDRALQELVELVYDEARDPFLLTIVFDRGRLRFSPGDCAITDEIKTVMSTSFGPIFEQVCKTAASGFIEAITLEGHTDNVPFFPAERVCGVEPAQRSCSGKRAASEACDGIGFANNVRLSASRAQNVFFQMRDVLGSRPEITSCLEAKFVVAGRGPVDPVDGADWQIARGDEENERNRRVVIKVRATSRNVKN